MSRFLATCLAGVLFTCICGAQASDIINPAPSPVAGLYGYNLPPDPEDTISYNSPLGFCDGGSVVLIANSAPPGATFQWLLNNGNINGATNSTYLATASGIYSVVVMTASDTVTYDPVTVTEFPNPIIDFTFNNNDACSGTPVQFISNITNGTAPFTYAWDFGDGATSTLSNPVHTFTSLGCATQDFTVTLVVTDVNGCTRSIQKTITVKQKPDVSVADVDVFFPFSNCENDPTETNPSFDITLTNSSPSSACIVSYSISWGDGTVQNNITFPISHTYTTLGAFQLQVTALGTNGCSNTRTYTVANQTNPAGGLGTLGATTGLCAPAVVPFVISNWQNNSPGTTYLLEFGDGTSVTLTHPLNDAMTADTVYHTYTESSCPSPTYTATLTVINACDETPYTAGNIQIREKPGADFTTPENVCVNTPVCFTNETELGNFGSNCSSVTQFEWDFGDGSPTSSDENPCHTYTTPGLYTVTLTATNPCGSSVVTRLVCVVAPLTPTFTIDNNEGCAPLTVTTNNTTPVTGCQPPVFSWSVIFTGNACNTAPGWSFINGTDANSENPQFHFTTAGNYTIVLEATNACGTFTTSRDVLVEAPPILTLSSIPNACGSATITPTAVVTNCGNGPLIYAWTFSGGTPATSSLPNPGPITFSSPGTHTVSLTVTSDCGPVTQTQTFMIYPVPGMNNPGPQSYCQGASTSAFNFAGTLPGSTYSWTNSNPAIGLPASGSGSVVPSFVTVNNGSVPVSGTITLNVTANGCNYTEDFTITVNPIPPVPVANNPVNYCQGSIGAPLTATALPGHTLNWYTSATGGTPSSTAPVPVATNPGTTTYYVSQVNTTTGCEGPRTAIDVIVNPSPVIGSFSSTNPTACGTSTGSITLTGLTAGVSYTVNYVKNGSPFSVTLVANASGNIVIPNLAAGNYTDIRVVLNFCPSNSVGPVVLVDPNPPATPVVTSNSPLCVGSTLQFNSSTTTGGAITYSWTGPGGFISTEQNPQITNVTFSNAGQYTATVTINGCSSSESVMVVVNPTPGKPQVIRPVEYCLNATASPLSATPDAGNTLTWYDNQALTNGTPNPFIPATNVAGTTVYYVSQTNSFNCVSDTTAIAVIVYPSITGNSIGRDTTLCSGNAPNPLTSQSALGGGNGAFTYQWQVSTDGGVTWNDIPGATNASYSPGPMSSDTHYRRKVWSGPCGAQISNVVVITVQGTLSNTGISADQVICSNTSPAELNGQAPTGGTGVFTYTWEESTDNVNWTIIPGANGQDFQPPVLTTTRYYRRMVSSGACDAYSAPVEIIVNPIPVATPIDDLLVCNTSSVPAINFTSVPVTNVSFTWTNNNPSIGLSASGSNGMPTFIATNTSDPETVITGFMSVTPTYTFSGVSCQGDVETFSISVLPTVTIDDLTDIVVCTGTTIQSITPVNHAAPPAGSSIVYNWQVSGSGITLPSTGSGNSIPSFNTINIGSTDLVATVTVKPVFQYNGQNCEGEPQSFTVTVKSATPEANGGPDVVLCASGSYTMQATSQSGVTGLWSQYSGPAAIITNATNPDAIISGLQPGQVYEFIWTVTGFASCPPTTDTVRIDVKEELSNSINTATQTICFGQTVTVDGATPTGGNGTYDYQWEVSTDQVNWSVIPGHIGEDLTISPTQTVYIRRIVRSPPCMTASLEAMVVVQPAITSNSISADQSVCINNAAALLQGATPTGGNGVYSFQWQQSTDGGSTWTNISGAQSMDYDPGLMTLTTKFRRIVTTSLCVGDQSSISNEVTITVNPDAEALFIPTADTACAPFNIDPAVIGLQPFPDKNEFYNWYADGTFIGAGVSFPGYTISGAGQSVEIKLVVTSPYGCKSDSMSHVFATPIEPDPSFIYSPTSGCGPLTVSFTNTTPLIGEFTYHWNFGNGQTSTDPQPGSIEFLPNPTFGDTTYYVTLSAITQCTSIVVTHPVTVHSKPKALFTPNVSVGCSPMTVSFNNTSLGIGNNYIWNFGDGSVPVTTSGPDPVSHTFYSGIRDTFFVQLIAINQCGSDTLQYAIVVSPNEIQLDYAINGNEFSGCTPHTVQFINNSSGATLFTWDFGDNNIISTTDNIDTITHTYLVPGTYTVTLSATNGCSDTSSVETIIVYPLPQSQFAASNATACIGNVVQFHNQSVGATSYLWNFGDNNTSTLTDPSHTYIAPGTYTVTLITYSFNAPGTVCTDTSTQLINVVTTLPGDFDASAYVGNCAPFVVDFTNNITPSVTANWDFGDGTTGTGDQVSHTYLQAGVYQVSLTVVVPGGCTYVTTKTITINGPIGTWTHTTGYLCEGRAANFQVTANNFDSLIYNFGDGTTLHTTDNFVYHTYANPGVYFPSVILKNLAGCEIILPGIDSIRVDAIKAGFTSTQVNFCGSTQLTFADTSHIFFGTDEVLWDFGDGTQGSGGAVEHLYTAAGLYQVRMIVTGLSGCADTVVMPIDVRVNNIPIAEIVSGPSVCTGVDVVFGSSIQSTDPINLIKWELSNGATGVDPSFNFNFTQPGTYTIRLIVGTVNGCYDTTSHSFQVNPTPQVNAGADHTICLGASIPLVASGINVASYSWSPLQGLSCYDCPNPIANPLITTPYVVQGMSDLGCPAYDTVVVTVIQPLQMTASSSDSICIGQSIDLLVSGAASYAWTPPQGLSSTIVSNPTASPTVTTTYRVVGYDGFNCFTDTAFITIGVGQYPTVNLGPDLVLSTGTMHPLTSVIQNGPIVRWDWTPSTDLSCDDCELPIAEIKKDITYAVKVITAFGCSAVDSIQIKTFCEDAQVFIPNAFTPDGDGYNDILMVRARGVAVVKSFRIFNRWGELVFERGNHPPNSPQFGWDGKVKGVAGAPDVYVYTAEVICENGTSYTYKGNVTLLK